MKKLVTLCAFLWLCIGCEAILEEDISNQTVVLLAPAENTQLSEGDINFSWQVMDDATSYRIQVATPNFANATQLVLDLDTTETNASVMLTPGTYQWRVSASNSEYSTSYTTINFMVN